MSLIRDVFIRRHRSGYRLRQIDVGQMSRHGVFSGTCATSIIHTSGTGQSLGYNVVVLIAGKVNEFLQVQGKF